MMLEGLLIKRAKIKISVLEKAYKRYPEQMLLDEIEEQHKKIRKYQDKQMKKIK